ncbi:hypothetical protein J4417_02755 [Candidatus Woesearchaeota archaeon]|nr:hypothetical protein [Candidatus Woesearchaeota archaeon]
MKKGNLNFSTGMTLRIIAGIIITVSLPFLITNPTNVVTQVAFGFGNFLMLLGGLTD